LHKSNICLHDDFGVVHGSEGKPRGDGFVYGGNDRKRTESNVQIELMHSD
jgi:hypothetical protein